MQRAKPNVPAKFTIEAVESGLYSSGRLQVSVTGDDNDEDVIVKDHGHGTYGAMYTPTAAGNYWIAVRFEHSHIPKSPFQVAVTEAKEEEVVVAAGPVAVSPDIRFRQGATDLAGEVGTIEFSVTQGKAEPGQPHVTAVGPDGQKTRVALSQEEDNAWMVRIDASMPGRYTANVVWAGVAVPGSPFLFDVAQHLSALQMHVRENVFMLMSGVDHLITF